MNVKLIFLIVYTIVFFWINVTYIIPSHNIKQFRNYMQFGDSENQDNKWSTVPKLKSASSLKKLHLNFPTVYGILMYVYYVLTFLIFVFLIRPSMLKNIFTVVQIITLVVILFYIAFLKNISSIWWNPIRMSGTGLSSLWDFYKQLWTIKHPENRFTFLFVLFGTLFLMIFPIRWILNLIIMNNPGANPTMEAVYQYLYYSPKVLTCDIKNSIQDIRDGKTPKKILYLFIIQIVIMSLFFIIPPITRSIQMGSGSILQKDPVYLDSKRIIGSRSTLNLKDKTIHGSSLDNTKENEIIKIHFVSFKLSFDTFIHQTGELFDSSIEKEIINYDGYPRITFDVYDHMFRVYLKRGMDDSDNCSKDKSIKVFETDEFRLQQWNHVELQYLNGIFDIFINGTLVSTTPMRTPCQHDPNVSIGDSNGIEGGIKNVIFQSLS